MVDFRVNGEFKQLVPVRLHYLVYDVAQHTEHTGQQGVHRGLNLLFVLLVVLHQLLQTLDGSELTPLMRDSIQVHGAMVAAALLL